MTHMFISSSKMFARKFFITLFALCIVAGFSVLPAESNEGFSEKNFLSVASNQNGYAKYVVTSRAELENYSVWGSLKITPAGKSFDSRGETFQAFFACYALHARLEEGTYVSEIMKPVRSVCSLTADGNQNSADLVSNKAIYEKVTDVGGDVHSLWQIEADGSYHIIVTIGGTGFFSKAAQFH